MRHCSQHQHFPVLQPTSIITCSAGGFRTVPYNKCSEVLTIEGTMVKLPDQNHINNKCLACLYLESLRG
ncbi:hypothetical protein A0H81_14702 [Grifola frondosa]|uniref:Uncharacterized protein n=1 Tax=Grifola frondosa TaxID=5627 RepID=A0A1C7LMW9_GRIFR|nr:hypothetical protein A0H81_14702 [Grifola frondosa]